jgi:hypothetical protein
MPTLGQMIAAIGSPVEWKAIATADLFWDNVNKKLGIGTSGGSAKLSINGGLHVGGDSDPGDNNLEIDGTLLVTGLTKTAGGVHVGGTSDPGTDNLLVDGIAEVTGDVKTVGYTDWSSSCSLGGFTGTPTKSFYYKKVGRLVFCFVYVTGTSTTGATTFTIPYTCASLSIGGTQIICRVQDNGVWSTTTPGLAALASGGTLVTMYKDMNGGAFTTSGTKAWVLQFFYEATS